MSRETPKFGPSEHAQFWIKVGPATEKNSNNSPRSTEATIDTPDLLSVPSDLPATRSPLLEYASRQRVSLTERVSSNRPKELLSPRAPSHGDLETDAGSVLSPREAACEESSHSSEEVDALVRPAREPWPLIYFQDFFREPPTEPSYPYYPEDPPVLTLNNCFHPTLKVNERPYREVFGSSGAGTQLESSMLKELVRFLEDSIPSLVQSTPNLFTPTGPASQCLLRFLQCNGFCVDECASHIACACEWLSTYGWGVLSPNRLSGLLSIGMMYFCGIDRSFRPVLVWRLSHLPEFAKRCISIKKDLPMLMNFWLYFFRTHLCIVGRVEQMTMLIDLTDTPSIFDEYFDQDLYNNTFHLFPDQVHQVLMLDQSRTFQLTFSSGMSSYSDKSSNYSYKDTRNQSSHTLVSQTRLPTAHVNDVYDFMCNLLGVKMKRRIMRIKSCKGLDNYIDAVHREAGFEGSVQNVRTFWPPVPTVSCPTYHKHKLGACRVLGKNPLAIQAAKSKDTFIDPISLFNRKAAYHQIMKGSTIETEVYLKSILANTSHTLADHTNFLEEARLACQNYPDPTKYCVSDRWERDYRLYITLDAFPKDLLKAQAIYWYGRDRKLRPNLVIHVKRLRDAIYATTKDSLSAIELLRFWLRWGSLYLLQDGAINKWNVMVNLEGVQMWGASWIPSGSSILNKEFPERLLKCYVFNRGWGLGLLGQKVIPGIAAAKQVVVKSVVELAPIMSLQQVCASLGGGGTVTVPLVKDAGPFTPTAHFPLFKNKSTRPLYSADRQKQPV